MFPSARSHRPPPSSDTYTPLLLPTNSMSGVCRILDDDVDRAVAAGCLDRRPRRAEVGRLQNDRRELVEAVARSW